ncbi:hypothetical protein AHF37_10904 [Paragonimus kellicotti]|nr:hypothetical protein AHF37_10904 [Paragonimus kellicotti]
MLSVVHSSFLQGLCYPSIHRLAGSWFPPHEFACLCGIMHSGYIFGTVLALSCSGYLIKSGGSGGWPLPFYVSGLLALVWLPAWIIFVSESPSSHPWISTAEKHYIEGSLRQTSHRDQRALPWRRLFRSTQVWLIMSCFILDGWSNYTLLVCVPQYMHNVLDVPINENGLLSSLPYIAAMGFMYVITFVDGLLIRRNHLSMPNMRKLWSCLSAFGKAVLLLTIAYLDRSYKTTIVVLLIINVMLSSAALLGFNLADLDLAPPYAGKPGQLNRLYPQSG